MDHTCHTFESGVNMDKATLMEIRLNQHRLTGKRWLQISRTKMANIASIITLTVCYHCAYASIPAHCRCPRATSEPTVLWIRRFTDSRHIWLARSTYSIWRWDLNQSLADPASPCFQKAVEQVQPTRQTVNGDGHLSPLRIIGAQMVGLNCLGTG